ncbi:MAG TPA: hypothetical protein VMW89_14755 [Desulfatiglandales bacterium]|nr:hypothetical protein [Desulfatiglandales bacterium]
MDMNRVDTLLRYILLVAGQEDPGNRELGPIHLVKYVYLADLAHSQWHKGPTYTNVPWIFHRFGPWSTEVYKRIEPVVRELDASERRISSPKYEDDFFRWELVDDELFEELDRQLPFEIALTLKKAVHEFGDDTSALLHYVYATDPMLRAAPGEQLSFEPYPEDEEDTREIRASTKDQRLSKTARSRLKEKMEAMLSKKLAKKKKPSVYTAPRYDQVFFEGQKWLDEIAGEPIESQEGQLSFSKEIWKSPSRTESDVS